MTRDILSIASYENQSILGLGAQHLWSQPKLALFCSASAPPGVVLAIHDLAQQWRRSGPIIAGGFQSPAEDEALTVLLRGPQPVIIWLARGLYREVPARFRRALAENRLLFLSPFPATIRRATAERAFIRNRLCAATAQTILIAHAQPGSKTEQLAREMRIGGKDILTLEHPANRNLLDMGAQVYEVQNRSAGGQNQSLDGVQ
jgi:predicted Rossmann fold nucleotide-binding protein DprA/Smf involved in DNA uptake